MKHRQIFPLTVPLLFFSALSCGQPVNQNTLKTIVEEGRRSHSDAIIIIKDNTVIAEEYYGQKPVPEYIASAGKSLVAIAIGRLIDDGKITSVDEPVCDFYPEWKQGRKKDVTIRMLLDHTSGLQNVADASVELEPPPAYKSINIIQMALCAELTDKPGAVFSYNNKAVALLGGIIEKASGVPFDQYFEATFYRPMGIKKYDWIRDQAGNPTAHGAFILAPMDLAKFGLLVLNKGIYNHIRLVSAAWIEQASAAVQPLDLRFGFLWWRLLTTDKRVITPGNISSLAAAGVDTAFITRLKPMLNDTLPTPEFNAKLAALIGNDWYPQINRQLTAVNIPVTAYREVVQSKDAKAFYADGFRGNFLVIVPSAHLVAVRVKGNSSPYDPQTDGFGDFVGLAARLFE